MINSLLKLKYYILSITVIVIVISVTTPILCISTDLIDCGITDRGVAVPSQFTSDARVPGYKNIRYSLDNSKHKFVKEFVNAIKLDDSHDGFINILAISGGGSDGAFGAGLLSGWTKHGSRPTFQVVTGVSTGALTAPFAFLGSKYDEILHKSYTQIHDEDVFVVRNVFSMIVGDSITTTTPLYETISHYINNKLMVAIAEEHLKGRRLYIMTTDLDALRPVVWDMGAIAGSAHPGSLDLFRRIILASASIPVVFQPQYFGVEANGEKFTEMHVDGGVMAEVFLHIPPANKTQRQEKSKKLRAYIIRNAKLSGGHSAMKPFIVPILTRTLASLIRTQGVGDLYEIYEQAQEGNADYRLAYVPNEIKTDHHDMFEPKAMARLFEAAYSLAEEGYPWFDKPPEAM